MLLALVLALLASCHAVDRNNFKTCQQSSFCRRHRAVAPDNSPYTALLDTLTLSPEAGVSVSVRNDRNNVLFTFHLVPLKDATLRLLMDEKTPLHPRFKEPFAVLEGNLKVDKFEVQRSETGFSLVFGQVRAELQAKPLLLNIFRDDKLVVALNAKGLLKYEHYRNKPQNQPAGAEEGAALGEGEVEPVLAEQVLSEQAVEGGPVDEEPDQDGLWEETFKGHTDSKPKGPASVGMDIAFLNSRHVYGIPEHADSFSLKDTASGDPYRLYNLDVFEYELDNPMALYASIPVMLSHSAQGSAGVFWHNAAETWVDVKHLPNTDVVSSITGFFSGSGSKGSAEPQVTTQWMSESGIIDLFVMMGPTPMDVFRQYAVITGTTNLPPLFSVAYHQCRWNYNDQQDVQDVNHNFDKYDIPMDVMWLDIEHTDGKRYFTWDEHKFPDPVAMTQDLTGRGRKLVTIVDPHIKRDTNYFFYKENHDLDHYIKTKDGTAEFDGWCWPGSSSYLDMTNPNARKHYMETFRLDRYKGSTLDTFTWNDMNEPSVFNGPEVTMQKDCLHPGLGVEHREVHNVNGMLFHASTYEGHHLRSDYKLRPFVLTRAAFAGSQRSSAIWTGDNTAEWGHLKISVPMLLSLSVTGLTHSGADIGGFFGNPDPALLARWYQAAAYTPFMRAHAHLDSKRREPWLFDRHTLAVIRRAIRDRYRLLPLWYTLFYENERTGAPPMRPVWAEFPTDESTFDLEHEYMVGRSLLVAPVLDAGASSVSVYFPSGVWYDTQDNSVYQGPDTQTITAPPEKIPVYQRGGSIIARKERVRRSSALMRNDPYTLVVAIGEQGAAHGRLYLDDEHSMAYRQGQYLYLEFAYSGSQLSGRVLEPAAAETRYKPQSWLERVVIVGLTKQPTKITMVTKEGGTVSLEGSFSAASGRTSSRLIIRKPDINIAEPFTISLH